jgi:hypothetical protein
MHDQYLSAWFYATWSAVTGMTTAFPGGMDYGRVSGGSGNFARYTVTLEKAVHSSDQNITTVHRIEMESYIRNPNTELKTVTNLIDKDLLAAMKATTNATIGGGAGEPTGTVDYAWKVSPQSANGSLQTEEQRKAGGDVECIKSAWLVRVQWA